MANVTNVDLPLFGDRGQQVGVLHLRLPTTGATANVEPILDLRMAPERDLALEPVQLMEGQEYVFAVHPRTETHFRPPYQLGPAELFSADRTTCESGRLNTGLAAGRLTMTISDAAGMTGRASVEVRSRKISYVSDYRSMLRDVADATTGLVLERFGPTELHLRPDPTGDAETLYQRFAFLKNLLSGEQFEISMAQILERPHQAWVASMEPRSPSQGLPAGPGVARQLTKPGPRVDWMMPENELPMPTLPQRVWGERWVETKDTLENRFVKYVLTHFLHFVTDVQRTLDRESPSAPVRRGLKEVEAAQARLEELLAQGMFAEVGPLSQLPLASQALQRRAGYRDLLHAYIQFETAALLTWEGGQDVYGAGQRDVATLYEYWVFLQVAAVVSDLCGQPLDYRQLLEVRTDGMGVALKRGNPRSLRGSIVKWNRRLGIELWFNRTFSARDREGESWTRPMRPDMSLRIIVPGAPGHANEDIWLHFDAKYRVETLQALFGQSPKTEVDETAELRSEEGAKHRLGSKRVDLLKMHAYRDAIRRSVGAYVIYPGTEPEKNQQYHELLPGLGAFPLKPVEGRGSEGTEALRAFLSAVLDHVGSQITQHERTRYWVREANQWDSRVNGPAPAVPFLTKPPADTRVLLGYIRDEHQWNWIQSNLRYNVRAGREPGALHPGSAALQVEFVLLYARDFRPDPVLWRVLGPPEVWFAEKMRQTGYGGNSREPRAAYFCLPLEPVLTEAHLAGSFWDRVFARTRAGIVAKEYGRPVTVTWLDLVALGFQM